MASDKRYGGYPISFSLEQVPGPGTDVISFRQVSGYRLNPNPQITQITPVGTVDPQAYIMAHADATYRVMTSDLHTIVSNFGLATGRCINNTSSFWFQRREKCGTFSTASDLSHIRLDVSSGFLFLSSITANQDDEQGAVAELSVEALSSDGLTLPVSLNLNQAVNTLIPPLFSSQFYLGPTLIGGSLLEGVTNWSLDSGITFNKRRTGGAVFPNKGAITARQPVLSITTIDLDSILSKLTGVFFNGLGAIEMYLRRGAENNTGRVASGTATHFKATASSGGVGSMEDIGVDGNDDGTSTVRILLKGTVSTSVAQAIP